MNKKLFGTDGIRGEANTGNMGVETVLKVARAAGHIYQLGERSHTILIGKDTRQSGYMIENALTAGLLSMGVDVRLVGPLPTPGVSYIMRSLRADGAIMISASHNPYYDNGIKFFGPDGFKLDDNVEAEIERLASEDDLEKFSARSAKVGRAKRIDDAVGRYIEFAKATFPKGMRLDGLRIVCDTANGATYRVGPDCLSELGAEVIPIANRPDGHNINENCGSVYPDEMRQQVKRMRADAGIAFDGDGDRVVMCDEEGNLLDGNALLAILATDMAGRGELPQQTVVSTVMANDGLTKALAGHGANLVYTSVGDRYVVEEMRRNGYTLGGESSGHVIMLDYNTTGDALIASLQILATMRRKQQPLSELASVYHALPEAHAKVSIKGKKKPGQPILDKVREEGEAALNGGGRIVIRPSGTEPIIRVMVQHETLSTARTVAEELAEKIAKL
ncbi:MAG: phosphoglucosamine mutase [Candidatus Hydrogenedentes bacterium]|jgi:phosphoglucosamine mutase|nr:phosphoglucosamine mutase [Candidatus Hydrogenedentota bacterium]